MESCDKHEDCFKEVWKVMREKVSLNIFMWIIGILTSILLIVNGYMATSVSNIKTDIAVIKTVMKINSKDEK